MSTKKLGKAKHPTKGRGLLAAVDIVIENTMLQHYNEDLTKREIAEYCEPFLPSDWIDRVLENALSKAIGERLRSAKLLDQHGNEVRKFGSYKCWFVEETSDGVAKERSYDCWKSWKHMDDSQQHQAMQAQIVRAKQNVTAVKDLVNYVNKEVRKPAGLPPMKLKWQGLKDSLK